MFVVCRLLLLADEGMSPQRSVPHLIVLDKAQLYFMFPHSFLNLNNACSDFLNYLLFKQKCSNYFLSVLVILIYQIIRVVFITVITCCNCWKDVI